MHHSANSPQCTRTRMYENILFGVTAVGGFFVKYPHGVTGMYGF